MHIAVDFDGTCVAHEYPHIGKDIGAIPVLKKLVIDKHKLILYTMRSGKDLIAAEDWFENNGIDLYASQVNPTQGRWTRSPKCYAEAYLDDAAIGTPLIFDKSISDRPFVDWIKMEQLLIDKSILSNVQTLDFRP